MQDTRILRELSHLRAFVIWRFVAKPGEPKPAKVPIWPQTGNPCNWMDPATWMLPVEALAVLQALGPGYGIGIVAVPGSNLLFIDLDSACDPSGGWYPHVRAFEEMFRGAYTETSVSLTGRHIVVRVQFALLPQHGTRNADFRMEAYSQARFLALTGIDAAGSLERDFTATAQRFLTAYFPPTDSRSADWRDGPVDDWDGPADDEELIAKACRSHGARAAYGRSAAFLDLWSGNVEILARQFPAQSAGKAYDGSAADMALLNHLAFWTGNDCPRMERLLRASALARPKHDRPDYMRRSILAACASQTEWYSGGDQHAAAAPDLAKTDRDGLGCEPLPHASYPVPDPPQAIQSSTSVTVSAGLPTTPEHKAPALASIGGGGLAPIPTKLPPPPDSIAPAPVAYIQGVAGGLAPGEFPSVGTFLNIVMARQHFEGCRYVTDINRIQLPDGTTQSKEQFDNTRGNWKWPIEPDGSKPSSSAWDCFLFNQIHEFPKAAAQYFSPCEKTGTTRIRDGRTEVNCYAPLSIHRAEGDPTPFIHHIQRLLPRDWELMFYTLAARVQFQGVKFMWSPFLQGTKGNGKTLLAKILEYSIGQRYTHWPKPEQLDEKFNLVLADKIIIIVDEMPRNALDIEPTLNNLVTATRLEIRPMYGEKIMREVCFNSMFISNHRSSLQCDPDQRRYGPFFCAQQHKADLARDGLTPQYFQWFRNWLENENGYAICAQYLSTVSIPRDHHPDMSIRAPETSSTYAAYRSSYTPAEQEIVAAIEEGKVGFRNGWISSHALDVELARANRTRQLPINVRRSIVEGLGYVAHPCLPDGLLHSPLADGTRPRLYIKEEHAWNVTYLTPDQVKTGYLEAQK
jgi:hypothetical protein